MNKKIWMMIGVLAIISTIIAIPIVGNESTHTDVTLESLELRLTNENIDVKKATAQLSLAKSQWDNAIADKAKSVRRLLKQTKIESTTLLMVKWTMNSLHGSWKLQMKTLF